jgi:hypothetical protein
MKKVFFTLALALTGLFASANNDVNVNQSIELQSNMILSEDKLSAEEARDIYYLGRFDVYIDGVYIGTYDVYLVIE